METENGRSTQLETIDAFYFLFFFSFLKHEKNEKKLKKI